VTERLEVVAFGCVQRVGLRRGRPGQVEVVLEVDRAEGVIERLAELADKGLSVTVELRSVQTVMGGVVDRQTGEVVASFERDGPMP